MSRSRLVLRALSIVLILFGVGLAATAIGLYAYTGYERAAATNQPVSWYSYPPSQPEPLAMGSEAGTAGTTPQARADSEGAESTAERDPAKPPPRQAETTASEPGASPPSPTPPASATPAPTRTPGPTPARWIRIPRIEVDSRVVEALIRNGEWEVPKYVAGHLQGTADPGEIGNVVLTGHEQSLTAGNVFARIGELQPEDRVFLYAGTTVLPYRVTRTFVVKNNDMSVVAPTSTPILTLITCTGLWNPFTRDYSERLIVVAEPVEMKDL